MHILIWSMQKCQCQRIFWFCGVCVYLVYLKKTWKQKSNEWREMFDILCRGYSQRTQTQIFQFFFPFSEPFCFSQIYSCHNIAFKPFKQTNVWTNNKKSELASNRLQHDPEHPRTPPSHIEHAHRAYLNPLIFCGACGYFQSPLDIVDICSRMFCGFFLTKRLSNKRLFCSLEGTDTSKNKQIQINYKRIFWTIYKYGWIW